MQIGNQTGLSITSLKLKVVELSNNGNGFTVENVDEAYFSEPVNFDKDKETKIYSVLQNAYNELLIKRPFRLSSVSLALPSELFHVMHIPYDNSLLNEDLIEEFKWEFSVNFPYLNARDLVIQYFEMEKNNFINYNSAVVIGIQRRYLQFFSTFCEKNELQLKFIDNAHFASERALAYNYPIQSKGLVLSVYIADNYLSLIFLFKGKPVNCKLIPLANASEIVPILQEELNTSEFVHGNRDILDGVFINGEDITDSLVSTLEELVEVEFIKFNPFEKFDFNPALSKNRRFTENYNSFGAAAGIAFRLS